jgi:HK97 family phage prohead protease
MRMTDMDTQLASLIDRLQKQIHAPSKDGLGYILPVAFKEVKELSSSETVIKGYTSTADLDRGRDRMKPESFSKYMELYQKVNPIVLAQHDHERPIGVMKAWRIDSNGLYVEDVIYNKTAAQMEATILVQQGVLRSFSIGALVHASEWFHIEGMDPNDWKSEAREVTEAELVEHSIVSVPMNAFATFTTASIHKTASLGLARKGGVGRAISRSSLVALQVELERATKSHNEALGIIKGLLEAKDEEPVSSSLSPEVVEQLKRVGSALAR